MKQYEAMFLFDPTFASDFKRVQDEVERILGRAGAEIVFVRKWDERKLAYEIRGRKRGCYVLSYFKCATDKIPGIERDAQLSEAILRTLVKRAEGVTETQITRLMAEARAVEEFAGEHEGGDFEPRRFRRRHDEMAPAVAAASTAAAVAEPERAVEAQAAAEAPAS